MERIVLSCLSPVSVGVTLHQRFNPGDQEELEKTIAQWESILDSILADDFGTAKELEYMPMHLFNDIRQLHGVQMWLTGGGAAVEVNSNLEVSARVLMEMIGALDNRRHGMPDGFLGMLSMLAVEVLRADEDRREEETAESEDEPDEEEESGKPSVRESIDTLSEWVYSLERSRFTTYERLEALEARDREGESNPPQGEVSSSFEALGEHLSKEDAAGVPA